MFGLYLSFRHICTIIVKNEIVTGRGSMGGPSEDGWNTVSSKAMRSIDASKMKLSRVRYFLQNITRFMHMHS